VSVEKSGESFQDKEEKENEASTSKMQIKWKLSELNFIELLNINTLLALVGIDNFQKLE